MSVMKVGLGMKIIKAELLMVSDFLVCFVITSGPITQDLSYQGHSWWLTFFSKKPDYG